MAGPGQGSLVPQAPRSTGHTASAPGPSPDTDLWDAGGDYRQTIHEDHPRWQQGMTATHMRRNSNIFRCSHRHLCVPFDTDTGVNPTLRRYKGIFFLETCSHHNRKKTHVFFTAGAQAERNLSGTMRAGDKSDMVHSLSKHSPQVRTCLELTTHTHTHMFKWVNMLRQ